MVCYNNYKIILEVKEEVLIYFNKLRFGTSFVVHILPKYSDNVNYSPVGHKFKNSKMLVISNTCNSEA